VDGLSGWLSDRRRFAAFLLAGLGMGHGYAILAAMSKPSSTKTDQADAAPPPVKPSAPSKPTSTPEETGGRGGLDPTRYGDWEINGRCVDF
jgi:hypothetical protein